MNTAEVYEYLKDLEIDCRLSKKRKNLYNTIALVNQNPKHIGMEEISVRGYNFCIRDLAEMVGVR